MIPVSIKPRRAGSFILSMKAPRRRAQNSKVAMVSSINGVPLNEAIKFIAYGGNVTLIISIQIDLQRSEGIKHDRGQKALSNTFSLVDAMSYSVVVI